MARHKTGIFKQLRRAQTRIIRKKDGRQTGRSALGGVTKDSLSSEETKWSGVAYRNPNSWGLNPSKWGVKPITMAMWTTCRVSLLVFFRKTMWCVCLKILYANGFAYHHFVRIQVAPGGGVFRHSPIFGQTHISENHWKSKWPESLWTSHVQWNCFWNLIPPRCQIWPCITCNNDPSIFWMLRKNEWYTLIYCRCTKPRTRMHKEHEV